MITIDIETISGVPLTGELKIARPMTSAQTRKLSRKMMQRGCGEQQRARRARSASSSTWRTASGMRRRARRGAPQRPLDRVGYFTL